MENNKKIKQINKDHEIDRVKIYIDDDSELDKIAFSKMPIVNKSIMLYFVILIIVAICTVIQVDGYIERRKSFEGTDNVIEIKESNAKIELFNNGSVPTINDSVILNSNATEATVETINHITLTLNKSLDKEVSHKYNIRYRIYENEFDKIDNTASLLVRFSYSLDNQTWTYINNPLTTTNSTLMPEMGNYYDISGLETTVNVATNYEIATKDKEHKIIYWKAETIYKNMDKEGFASKKLNATFAIDYVE